MDDIKLALLGSKEAAKRLTEAGVLVPCAGCGGENAKHMTLEQLREMDAGEEKVRQALIERNLRLVVYIARRFENTGINIDDLISIGTIGLIKAISTYKSERNIKLATYAGRCIENEILMFLRKNSSQRNEVSLDEPLNTDWDGNELLLSDVLGTEPGTPAHRF